MLVRAYRFTDKLGTAILKGGAALAGEGLERVSIGVGLARRGSSGIGRTFWRATMTVFGLLWGGLRRVALVFWALARLVLGVIGAAALFFFNGFLWATGTTIKTAGKTAAGAATNAMARRAARAELDTGLTEDPLRVQNRVLSGLVVVILVALIGVVLWATNPARTQTPIGGGLDVAASFLESTPIATSASAVVFATPVPTATEIPAVLQARGSLAYVVREKGQQDIWVVGVGSRIPIRLTNDSSDERDPAWSPDGRRLAYASRRDSNWEIYIYDLTSGETTRMTYGLEFQGGPQWSPDGRWLTYESYQGNNLDIYVVPLDGSQPPLRLPGNSDAPDFAPSWSPDGRKIAFVSWRDGNQDIYVFSLDNSDTYNLTNTAERQENHPAWSPDGKLIAYSAVDLGLEKVFVKPADDPEAEAQVIGRGRAPAWSPDGASLVFAVDSIDGTQLIAAPYTSEGVATLIVPAPLGASDPAWTTAPLPPALVNSGGLPAAIPGPLFIEQESPTGGDPPFKLADLVGVNAPQPYLSDRVNDSFNALRQKGLEVAGWDFLGHLEDAFWPITRLPQPGEERRNWLMTGRAFAINRNSIVGFPPPIEVVREDLDVYTYWRVYVRVTEEAQSGQLGEPLRYMPWDFLSRNQGDIDAYNQGGRLRREMPKGYYIDLTQLAADYGWERVTAGNDWRANTFSINYWLFEKRGGLTWYDAMRELYTEGQMGGFVPTATPAPVQQPGG